MTKKTHQKWNDLNPDEPTLLKRKNEQGLKDEIQRLKSAMIDLQATVIQLLRQDNDTSKGGSLGTLKDCNRSTPVSKSPNSAATEFFFESTRVRIVDRDGEIWFVASDVCQALEIVNHRDAISRLDPDEKGVGLTDTLGGQQETVIINESGLYMLVLRCRNATKSGSKPHKFRKWVTSEILPAIRKTGRYNASIQRLNTESSNSIDSPFSDCGIHDAEFLAFLAVTKGRMGGRRNMSEQVSIHTAKVLHWLWYHCPCETEWYEASRIKMGQDLGMCHTTALRCAKRLEAWRFIEQRMIGRVTECKLLRSRVATALEKAGAFQWAAVPASGKPLTVLSISNASSSIDLGRLADVAGSPAATVFLVRAIECQHETGAKNGGWWRKTRNEWTAETGLSRCEQESARRALRRPGILSEARRGLPAKMWYRIDEAVLTRLMNQTSHIGVAGQPRWH